MKLLLDHFRFLMLFLQYFLSKLFTEFKSSTEGITSAAYLLKRVPAERERKGGRRKGGGKGN